MLLSLDKQQATENFRNIVVIGASAGGISAITNLLSLLPENPDAAFLVVVHQSPDSDSKIITGIFKKRSTLDCIVPEGDTLIQRGNLYLAPSNFHMLVKPGLITINDGPREHRYRPSIDVLFRSAAAYYGPRVIAVILTGMLDDGTAGMIAVKSCGGTTIVQDPDEAEYNQMPVHVLNRINVDYILPVGKIGNIIGNLLSAPVPAIVPVPEELKTEVEMTERMMTSLSQLSKIADRSDFICPDCGGGLWKMRNDRSDRYRCHVGHVYSGNSLLRIHSQEIEESLWVSVRMLEERRNMMELMLKDAADVGRKSLASYYRERIEETGKHISSLKALLSGLAGNAGETGEQIA